jgi:DNA-binding NarL/FixJ family response regulator
MRARAQGVGGKLAIVSSPGGPTTIHLIAPLTSEPGTGTHEVSLDTLTETRPGGHVIRVLVVDDHPLYREALAGALARESDIRVVGEATTAQEALALTARARPDVVLLDLELPDKRGDEIVQSLLNRPNPPQVLMLSAFTEGTYVAAALAEGARGYLAKSSHTSVVVDSIRAAVRGATMFTAATWQQLVGSAPSLTARELQVLTLLACGHTNAEIATTTHVAPKTVERIVATVSHKLGARNRTHAVARAMASRLLDPRPLLRN